MTRGYRKTLGDWGEQVASTYLESQGYEILARNYHSRHGELDLIATKNKGLYFIEVKTRSNHAYGLGEESINVEGRKGDPAPTILHYENIGEEAL